jgi:DNA-binding Xre family transcriptional regulator
MRAHSSQGLARQLKAALAQRGMNQRVLAAATQSDPTRISRLFSDLASGRARADRLTLLLEICDILDMAPVLVPATRLDDIQRRLDIPVSRPGPDKPSAFDDLFIDLADETDE